MKTINELSKEISESLNLNLDQEQQNKIAEIIFKDHKEKTRIQVHGEKLEESKFEELARPMIKYLCENYNPHVTVIITPTSAELLGGLKSIVNIDDYLRD